MKIKPTTYAQLLIGSIPDVISSHPEPAAGRTEGGEKSHHNGNRFASIARRLWYMLQKNKQYRDLPKILDELEKVYAAKEGFTIAYIESGEELSAAETDEIKKKLALYCHFDSLKGVEKSHEISRLPVRQAQGARDDKKIIIQSKVNPAVTGIMAKIEGKVIDLSVEDKISKLRKKLNT